MGLFENKRGVILGLANEYSIAWAVAQYLHKEGAQMAFSHLPDRNEFKRMERRVRRCTDTIGASLVLPCDVTSDEEMKTFFAAVQQQFGKIDFCVHSIAFAPLEDIRCATTQASRAGFHQAFDISVYSFLATIRFAAPMMNEGGTFLAMSYFGGEKVVGGYNLMGLAKAALEHAVRYAAFDLGPLKIRVNALSSGPLKTLAASAISELDQMLLLHSSVAPLGRNITRDDIAKSSAYLLSDLSSGVTGETLHVDSGYHVMGSPGHALQRLKGKIPEAD